MVVTTPMHCDKCGYGWQSRSGKSKKCPSCFRVLGESRTNKWKRAEEKLAKILALRGWRLERVGGQKVIDIDAEKNRKRLLIDVKSGDSYLIRRSQLKELLKHRDKTTNVGFALEEDGKFYMFMLEDIL